MSPLPHRSRTPWYLRRARVHLEPLEDRSLLTVSVIDNFLTNPLQTYTSLHRAYPSAAQLDVASVDGRKVLDKQDGYEWMVRADAGAQVRQGQTLSVWVQFADVADGRAYIGFGARPQRFSGGGTLSLVLAANQLILQDNNGYAHTQLAAASQSFQANHWYRAEVVWQVGGNIMGRVYDSDGVSLLRQVTAVSTGVTSGGIAFRAFGNDKYFHTVVLDDNSSASPLQLAQAGDGLQAGWDPAGHPVPPANQDSGGNSPVPWLYQSWAGSGRDVELMTFNGLQQYAYLNGRVGLAAGNVSRVLPNSTPIDWGPAHYSGTGAPAPETPLLAQYLFRQRPGEATTLIGASDVKHFFAPSVLGPGQTDTYSNGLNAIQSYYIPGSELDPGTGRLHRKSHFGPANADGNNVSQTHSHNALQHLLQVAVEDLDPAWNPSGTRWFLMGNLFVAADQNVANNSRWQEVRPQGSGSNFSFTTVGTSQLDFRLIPGLSQPAGPFVLEQTPRSYTFAPLSTMRVRFNTPIDVSTFTPYEVYFLDTAFNYVPATSVTPVPGSGNREFSITVPAQSASGYYYLALGQGILDAYGNSPDQNQNGVLGEFEDYYIGYFYLIGGGAPSGGLGGGAELVWTPAPAPQRPAAAAPVLSTELPPAAADEWREQPAPQAVPGHAVGQQSQGQVEVLDSVFESDVLMPSPRLEIL